jgi:hypothetical protein
MLKNVSDAIGDEKAAMLLIRMHKTFRITCLHENVNDLMDDITSSFQESFSPELPWHPSIIETIGKINRRGFVSCFLNWRRHIIRMMNAFESRGFTFKQLDRELPLFIVATRQDFKSRKMLSHISNTRRRVSLIDGKIRSLMRNRSSSEMLICDSPTHGDSSIIVYECFIKSRGEKDDDDEEMDNEFETNDESNGKLNMIALLREAGVTSDDSVSRWLHENIYNDSIQQHSNGRNVWNFIYDSYARSTDAPEPRIKFDQTIKKSLFLLAEREIERMKQTTQQSLFRVFKREMRLGFVSDLGIKSIIDGIVAKRKRDGTTRVCQKGCKYQ